MILLILCLLLLLPVAAGTYAIITAVHRWSQVREEQLRALKQSNEHQNALRAIQVAKAWEKATMPDPTPQLTKPKEREPDLIITADEIVEPITHKRIVDSGYDEKLIAEYLKQEHERNGTR